MSVHRVSSFLRLLAAIAAAILLPFLTWAENPLLSLASAQEPSQPTAQSLTGRYQSEVLPIIKKYCLQCHSTEAKKGSLDLERFAGVNDIRKDLKPWQNMIEQIESGEMPPKKKPQPTDLEKKQLLTWVRAYLDHEARTRAGDPGHAPLRRLSNAEFDYTIRDLTGVDLKPTREFPPDGAAGEGFTNAAEALTDISPALLTKYLNAAKELAEHAVLLPDGFRFSPAKTRRDWTDEGTRRLQQFYASVAPADGRLPLQSYLLATIKHRAAIQSGERTFAVVAAEEKLNAKYLRILWNALHDKTPSITLDGIRQSWSKATEKDVPALLAEITRWQSALWKTINVANYVQTTSTGYAESQSRQAPVDPTAVEALPIRFSHKPLPGQNDVVFYLSARDLLKTVPGTKVIWQRPRLEAVGKPPLLLADYSRYKSDYEVDYASVFASTTRYLEAVAQRVHEPKVTIETLAQRHSVDGAFLQRWLDVLGMDADKIGRVVPVVALQPLTEKLEKVSNKAWINGWKKAGQELPILVTNSSDTEEHIPGRAAPHSVTVHPMPKEFVAVTWKSPVEGPVKVSARITSVHPACGNGVAWWLEHRHADRALMFAEGAIGIGGEAKPAGRVITLAKDDLIMLAVDARNGDHGCDLTDIALTITEDKPNGRTWNLAADIANSIHDGNPHPDQLGHSDTWSFVYGPARNVKSAATVLIPPGSLLDQWRAALAQPNRQAELEPLAKQVQALLTGTRTGKDKDPNSQLFDNLLAIDGPLFQGIAPRRLSKPASTASNYGLPKDRYNSDASLVVDANSVTAIRLPSALVQGRELVIEGKLEKPDPKRVVQFQVLTSPPTPYATWDGKTPVVAVAGGKGYSQLLQGYNEFRQVFPLFLCYPQVIPNDEAVSLKMFHREDDALNRLFLEPQQIKELDHWWEAHRYISRQAVAEHAYLPQFIGFVSQDGAPGMLEYFKAQLPVFKARADVFLKEEEDVAQPRQLSALTEFATKAFRRPLTEHEQQEFRSLYQALRSKGVSHDEAFRGLLTRIFVSPAFLFRIEHSPAGKEPGAINDWELACRLSYFLWSSTPDEELRRLAASGHLSDDTVLDQQVQRMLKDARLRALAIEFGTQWIHVRGFDDLKEKNEQLFPTFNANLRSAIYEESILFFQDLFQQDRPVTHLLDADSTYLNETLAKHYGIPGVAGNDWRLVTGVKQYGRGGLLGLASVQTKEAGASRTSPILRGNWVVETLLGEKLPKPPPNVPKLPEVEGMDKLTMKQLVQQHTSLAECATCHQRIDPFGFALEKYDPIGRRREKDLGGLPVDAKAVIKDGTTFDDIDGLRHYLLSKKKEVIVRLFCKRLSGYALGRAVTLSDSLLLDQMVAELDKNGGHVSAALRVIVHSPQFRKVRGSDYTE